MRKVGTDLVKIPSMPIHRFLVTVFFWLFDPNEKSSANATNRQKFASRQKIPISHGTTFNAARSGLSSSAKKIRLDNTSRKVVITGVHGTQT